MQMTIANKRGAVLGTLLIAAAASGWGCISPAAVNPPIVNSTPLGVATRPAKPPDCAMPVLDTMPLADHQQIALVDAWGDLAVKDDDLLGYLKRESCQLGADAVVLTSQHLQREGDLVVGVAPGRFGSIGPGSDEPAQVGAHLPTDPEGGGKKHHAEVGEVGHPGRYMNAIAIIYTKGGNAAGTSSSSSQ
jgi:hypothetical protein